MKIHLRVIAFVYLEREKFRQANPGASIIVQVVSELSRAKRAQRSTVGKEMK